MQLAPQLKTVKFIPKFLLENPCAARVSLKISGYSFSRDNFGYPEIRHNQSWSAAGHRLGFADPRGTLFFEITRLAEAKQPSYLLVENVPRILLHDQGEAFATILSSLHELGYGLEWAVLNSADYGTPQARRRVYIVGYLDSRCAGKIFPVAGANGKALVQVLGGPQGSRVYDVKGVACTQTAGAGGMGGKTGLYLIPPGGAFVDLSVGERES